MQEKEEKTPGLTDDFYQYVLRFNVSERRAKETVSRYIGTSLSRHGWRLNLCGCKGTKKK